MTARLGEKFRRKSNHVAFHSAHPLLLKRNAWKQYAMEQAEQTNKKKIIGGTVQNTVYFAMTD